MQNNKEAIQQIREQLIENPDHPNAGMFLKKIEQLQGNGQARIEDLRLAINYSRNVCHFISTWDCMLCHKEIASIFRYLNTGELGYKIDNELDEVVQLAVWLAETENYKKQYPEELPTI